MIDSKFTVNEIIKGLECLDGKHDRLCGKCSFGKYCVEKENSIERNCRHIILNEVINIIKQAKQEVAREIFEEFDNLIVTLEIGDNEKASVLDYDKYAELKKKYIGE